MSLRSNKLEFLPDEIGQMTKLRVLNLSDNRYSHTTVTRRVHARRRHFSMAVLVLCDLTARGCHGNQ